MYSQTPVHRSWFIFHSQTAYTSARWFSWFLIVLSHNEERELETRVPQRSEQIILNSNTFYKNKTDGDISNLKKCNSCSSFDHSKNTHASVWAYHSFLLSSISLTSSKWDCHYANNFDLEIDLSFINLLWLTYNNISNDSLGDRLDNSIQLIPIGAHCTHLRS